MRRRDVLSLLGGAAVPWPLGGGAQQPAMPVIGFLGAQTPELFVSRLGAFHQALKQTGYVEGRNVVVEYRWAEGRDGRLLDLASDLVQRHVAVIVTSSTSSTVAAKAATTTIPIVFSVSSDPVQLGLVESLNRPGGHRTGSTNLGVEAGSKRLELLRELLPAARVMAFLVHPDNPGTEGQINEHQAAAHKLGLRLHVLRASSEGDLDAAFANLHQLGVDGLVIGPDSFFNTRNEQLATLALHYRVPAVYNDQPFVIAGGLMSYGANITDQYRIAGLYAGRILKGEKPGDLPVQQSTKLSCSLTSRLPTRSASPSRRRCSPLPTRSSNEPPRPHRARREHSSYVAGGGSCAAA
jgi:putative ABC transport system substrate-binding protein